MKIFIEHDEQGTIKSIGSRSSLLSEENHLALVPRPGHQVAEVEVPDVKDEKDYERLREIKRHHRIEVHQGEYRLVRK